MMSIGDIIPWRGKDTEINSEDPAAQSAVTHFHSEIDRLFDRLLGEPFWRGRSAAWSPAQYPSLDVREEGGAIIVQAEVPGVDPKDLDITVTGDVLALSGEKKDESEERTEGLYHSERVFGSFRRTIALPSDVDRDSISADYEQGVLTIRLRKVEQAVTRRIPVSAKN